MWSRPTTSSATPSTATTSSPCGMRSAAISPRRATGGGPFLLECLTHRLRGHYEGDPAAYREALADAEWQAEGSDPAAPAPRDRAGWFDEDALAAIEAEAAAAVERRVRFARESPFPPVEPDRGAGLRRWLRRPTSRRSPRRWPTAMRADERVLRPRRGRRRGRAVHRDRRPGRGVRHRARDQHADQRGRDHRRRDRRGAVGHAAGARDHVHRLHHARARPARQRRRQGALHVGRPADGAAGAAHAGRRRPARRGAALAEPRELAHPRAGPQGRDAEPRGRRCRTARRARSPTRIPSCSSRTRRSTSARGRCPSRPRRCRSARQPPFARAATSRSSPSRAWSTMRSRPPSVLARRRDRGRGDRPAHARPARPRRDRRVRRAHGPARRRP